MPEKITIVQAINMALRQEMERDDKVIILGEDVGKDGGVFRVTEGLYQKFGPNRVLDTPLAESAIVGTAIGMAAYGLRPVAEIQFDGFIYGAMEQLISHAARIRTRSRGRFSCPIVLRAPYSGGIHAPEHHSESMEALYIHIPGLKVVIPSTPYDSKGLLISSIRDPDPVIFLEPKKIYRSVKQEVPEEIYAIPLGKANKVLEGTDVTLISWGAMMRPTLEAAELAKSQGVVCEVIDMRTLFPFDQEAILSSVNKTGRVVIIQEAPRTCSFASEIAAILAEKVLLSLEAPIERVTGFDTVMPLYKLENEYLPDSFRVLKAIEKVANF